MKRLLLISLTLFLLLPLFSQNELSLIQIDQEEIDREVQRFLLQNQVDTDLTQEEYTSLEESVREGLIMRKLLVNLAAYREIRMNKGELDTRMAQLRGGYPEKEWVELLESQLYTEESFRNTVEEGFLMEELLDLEVLSKISVTDEEVKAYYDAHPDQFGSDFGTIDFLVVEEMIKENLLKTKGQEEVSLFMDNLYKKAMFVVE